MNFIFGLQWNISDYFYQNAARLRESVTGDDTSLFPFLPGLPQIPPFDRLWLCVFSQLGRLCVDTRPAVRKSACQTLFSTISAHGSLLEERTWQAVVDQVLIPLLDSVNSVSREAAAASKGDERDGQANTTIGGGWREYFDAPLAKYGGEAVGGDEGVGLVRGLQMLGVQEAGPDAAGDHGSDLELAIGPRSRCCRCEESRGDIH